MMGFLLSLESFVRHFNITILILLFQAIVFSKEISLIVQLDSNSTVTDVRDIRLSSESEFADYVDSLQLHYLRDGLLKTTLSCISLGMKPDTNGEIIIKWKVSNPGPVYIDSIVVLGVNRVFPQTILNFFKPLILDIATEQSLLKAYHLLDGYRSLTFFQKPYYATYQREKVAIVLPVQENFQNSFTGAAGYLPQHTGKPQVTGDIRIHLENPFGTASLADFQWLQKDRKSQMFSISYEEPWVWKFNMGIKALFYQNLQDGLYVKRKFHLSAIKSFSPVGKWSIGGENSSIKTTPEGDSLGIDNHTVRSLVIENEWERRDNTWNPRKGFYLRWNTEVGDYSVVNLHKKILYRFRFLSENLKHLHNRWLLALIGMGGYVHISGLRSIPQSEQFRFGGASTLRGFQEQSMISNWMVIGQLELRYLTGRLNRVYLFLDSAIYEGMQKSPIAGGIGIQQKIPLGTLSLEYALNRDDSPSKGKIHIKLLGQF